METFIVYCGCRPNGELEHIAISESVTDDPADFFPPGVEVKRVGALKVEGDTHLLNDYIVIP